jgi:hypothetical protein
MAAKEAGGGRRPNEREDQHREPPVVVVDVANVAYGRQGRGESAKLTNVNAVLGELGRMPIKVVAVADAALRHKIDHQDEYEKMIDDGQVEQAPAGTDADEFIWSLAERYRSKGRATYILTNDRFPIEKSKKAGMAHPDRITFMFVEGELIFQPPLSDLSGPGREPPIESSEIRQHPTASVEPVIEEEETDIRPVRDSTATDSAGGLEASSEGGPPAREKPPQELLDQLRAFFSSRANLGATSLRVNFATVAHFLHSTHGGNFTTQFGYHRPKDLALALESGGYAVLSHHTTTLYIEPTTKLLGEAPTPDGN